jgi:NodT family efflux transporter outer membrane factor (OMF) lipoprotein
VFSPGKSPTASVLVLLGVLVAQGACTVLGPDYEEPEVGWLGDWQTDLYGQLEEPEAGTQSDLSFWWMLFRDPTLNALVETAKRDNIGLRVAGLRILESRAVLGIAGSARYPQVQQVTGAVTYVTSREHGGASNNGSTDLASYDAGLGLGWELDFWGRFRRGIESADAAFFASLTNHQDAQVLLSAQVADLYYALLTTRMRIGIARANAEIQRRSLEITQELFDSGQDSELDVQQARTQYLTTVSTIPELEIVEVKVLNALSALLGRPPGELPELADMADRLPGVDPSSIEAIPARLVTRRPDVRAAAWGVAAQSAQIGIAQADYYPAIAVVGTVGWAGNSLSATPDVGTLAAGPALTWNVFDHGRIRNNVRVQDARLQQAIAGFQNTVLQAAREIDDAAVSVVKTRERQATLAHAVLSASRALDLARVRYREGYSDFQRVLDAQRALFGAAERDLVNKGNHISAVIQFYKALGGGWTDMPIGDLLPDAVREKMRARSNWGDLLDAPLPANQEGPVPAEGGTTP